MLMACSSRFGRPLVTVVKRRGGEEGGCCAVRDPSSLGACHTADYAEPGSARFSTRLI